MRLRSEYSKFEAPFLIKYFAVQNFNSFTVSDNASKKKKKIKKLKNKNKIEIIKKLPFWFLAPFSIAFSMISKFSTLEAIIKILFQVNFSKNFPSSNSSFILFYILFFSKN
jgi:hypothetical protein